MRILSICTCGPLILAHMPDEEMKTKMWRKDILPAMTKMMRSHGLRQNDIFFGGCEYADDLSDRFQAALEGEAVLAKFYLYRYDEEKRELVLLRGPIN